MTLNFSKLISSGLIALGAILTPLIAQAGRQYITGIENATYELQANKLIVSGTVSIRSVRGAVQTTSIAGQIKGVNCSGPRNPCSGSLHVSGNNLLLDIEIDQDQDGNIDNSVKNIPVASKTQGNLTFAVPVKAVFVQERYSFLEKLQGLKNKDFVAITLQLSIN